MRLYKSVPRPSWSGNTVQNCGRKSSRSIPIPATMVPAPIANKRGDDSDKTSVSSEGKPDIIPGNLLDGAQIVTKSGNLVTKDGVVISTQESDASLSTNVFADPEIRDFYVKMYEKAKYECRHAFDADLTWTDEEEKKLIRKVDWRSKICFHFYKFHIANLWYSLLMGLRYVLLSAT